MMDKSNVRPVYIRLYSQTGLEGEALTTKQQQACQARKTEESLSSNPALIERQLERKMRLGLSQLLFLILTFISVFLLGNVSGDIQQATTCGRGKIWNARLRRCIRLYG